MQENNLKQMLKSRKTTLAAVAAEMGVNRSTLTRWSKARVPAERVKELSSATGIPAKTLRPDIFNTHTSA